MSQAQGTTRIGRGLDIAVAATVANIGCDLLLHSGPSAGSDISETGFMLQALAALPLWRVGLGAGLGIVLISTWLLTVPALYVLLGGTHPRMRYAIVLSLAVFAVSSATFHGSYALLAGAGKLVAAGELDPAAAAAPIDTAMTAVMVPMMVSLLAFSVLLAASILGGRTALPRWTAAAVPLLFASIPPMLAALLPAPWGGTVAIAASTTGLAAFYAFVRWCWQSYGRDHVMEMA